jgi:hypothetical protein
VERVGAVRPLDVDALEIIFTQALDRKWLRSANFQSSTCQESNHLYQCFLLMRAKRSYAPDQLRSSVGKLRCGESRVPKSTMNVHAIPCDSCQVCPRQLPTVFLIVNLSVRLNPAYEGYFSLRHA